MILVTGATGMLGNCVVRELIDRGESVRVLCRPSTSRAAIEGLQVEVHAGDLSSDSIVASAVAGCSAVVHSAALIHIGWQKLAESREVNVAGTQRIIAACRQSGAKLVHVSTVDTLLAANSIDRPINEQDPRPQSFAEAQPTVDASQSQWVAIGKPKLPCAYVISKFEAEQSVRAAAAAGVHAIIVHPGFMLGPFDWKPSSGRMMLEIRKPPLLIAPRGGCSVCDARDVAAAIVNAIDRGQVGESYILAGENLTYQHLWQTMLAEMGLQRKVLVGGPMVVAVGKAIDAANRLCGFREGDVNGAIIGMGNMKHYYDSTRAERELAYLRRPLAETMHDAWEWLRAHHGTP